MPRPFRELKKGSELFYVNGPTGIKQLEIKSTRIVGLRSLALEYYFAEKYMVDAIKETPNLMEKLDKLPTRTIIVEPDAHTAMVPAKTPMIICTEYERLEKFIKGEVKA